MAIASKKEVNGILSRTSRVVKFEQSAGPTDINPPVSLSWLQKIGLAPEMYSKEQLDPKLALTRLFSPSYLSN